jgi:hypothetical protein
MLLKAAGPERNRPPVPFSWRGGAYPGGNAAIEEIFPTS